VVLAIICGINLGATAPKVGQTPPAPPNREAANTTQLEKTSKQLRHKIEGKYEVIKIDGQNENNNRKLGESEGQRSLLSGRASLMDAMRQHH
jgi:hypothetical protein